MPNKKINYIVNIYLSNVNKENNFISLKLNKRGLDYLKKMFESRKVIDCGGYIVDLSKVLYINYKEV